MYSGVASCDSAPVEKVFSHVKRKFALCCEARLRRINVKSSVGKMRALKQKEIIEELVSSISLVGPMTIKKIFP